MRLFKREKQYSLPSNELDEFSTRIFHFVYEHQRLPTNEEMFLDLKIPSASLDEVIHYFNHPPRPKQLKKYTQDQIQQLDAQSILILPFIKNDQLNLTDIVIRLNYSLSNGRELVNFCNTVIQLSEKKISDYYDLFDRSEIEINVVRIIQTHHRLKNQPTSSETVSLLELARECRLGILSTRVGMTYYKERRLHLPKTTDLDDIRKKELDAEIRQYLSDLPVAEKISLEDILVHDNWKLPIPDPPELTIENVTKITDNYVRTYDPPSENPLVGLFQLAGDTIKNLIDTFITPTITKVFGDSIPDPTLSHAQEILCILQTIREQNVELAPLYSVGSQTIEYVPAEQVEILKAKDRFFCSLCLRFYPKKDPHQVCASCQRAVCQNCYQESQQAGLTKCSVCQGSLRSAKVY
ncbi:MAG: hypothetical protein ACFFFG_10490 [Candidatus Thorarchaeota archaeon]